MGGRPTMLRGGVSCSRVAEETRRVDVSRSVGVSCRAENTGRLANSRLFPSVGVTCINIIVKLPRTNDLIVTRYNCISDVVGKIVRGDKPRRRCYIQLRQLVRWQRQEVGAAGVSCTSFLLQQNQRQCVQGNANVSEDAVMGAVCNTTKRTSSAQKKKWASRSVSRAFNF